MRCPWWAEAKRLQDVSVVGDCLEERTEVHMDRYACTVERAIILALPSYCINSKTSARRTTHGQLTHTRPL